MKTQNNNLRFWVGYGKYLFLFAATIFAILSLSLNFDLKWIMIGVGVGFASYLGLSQSRTIRLVWSLIIFAIFVLFSRVVITIDGYSTHLVGIFFALVGDAIVFCNANKWSLRLKLHRKKDYNLERRMAWCSVSLVVICVLFGVEVSQKRDFDFAKERFVKVKSSEKEYYKDKTYFVITTTDGRVFGIQPSEYPEIRNIHSESEVRVLLHGHNVYGNLVRLEIKN